MTRPAPQRRGASVLWLFLWPSSGISPWPSCAGDLRAGCSTPGGVSPQQRDWIPSLNLLTTLLLVQPRVKLAYWAGSTHGWLIHQHSQSPSLQVCSQSLQPPAVLIAWVASTQVHGTPCTFPVELHEVPKSPLLKLVQVPLDDILVLGTPKGQSYQ